MGHQQVICESFLSKNFICHQFVKVSPAKVLAITALSMDIKASAKVFCGNAANSFWFVFNVMWCTFNLVGQWAKC